MVRLGGPGEANPWSDLDLHVLVHGDRRWRSNFLVDGVPVEVFHNPARQIRALLAAEDSATIAMYVQGRPVQPHPELDALQQAARERYAQGRTARPPSEFERFMLIEMVMDARARVDDPVHPLLVMNALSRLAVRPLYAARGWWDVKPEHWLADLGQRDPALARQLRAVLTASTGAARQGAFETLALQLTGDFTYRPGQSEPDPGR
ncbi:hypothetical protein [Deinococcus sonorensis]|uniref:Polymerase nucleotidyl transferase domain-containing protein n=2 Tax=Deinococcus sonorensis TaxID=309891 RepID=A0AAU7UBS5_9DEIO